MLVTIFVYSYNPQITKARIFHIYKSNITLNSGLSMLVGISEAIRLLFFNLLYTSPRPSQTEGGLAVPRTAEISPQLSLPLTAPRQPLLALSDTSAIADTGTRNEGLPSVVETGCDIPSSLGSPFGCWRGPSISQPITTDTNTKDTIFHQWLAGVIDGAGCFQFSKKGYASLEIVMETRDKHCLYQIKQKFGGSVKLRSGVNFLRYRLHHKKGLLTLIEAVNGEIRNPVRLLQLNKICENYNITVSQPSILTYSNGWFSGFFDSDGSVYINLSSYQVFITASQKNKYILDLLPDLYGGTVYIQKESFKWTVYKKAEILNLLDYFKLCPSRSAKHNRLKAINRYHELRALKAHLSSDNSILGKAWKKFLLRWDKWLSHKIEE